MQRRKLLRSIAVGGGAVITGKSLPENWMKPIIESVVLPAHAQTSPSPSGPSATLYSETLSDGPAFSATRTFNFDVTGITPNSDGTLDVTALGDVGELASEFYDVFLEGVLLGRVGPGPVSAECSPTGVSNTFAPIDVSDLVAAAGDNVITITAVAGPGVGAAICVDNTVTVSLSFSAI